MIIIKLNEFKAYDYKAVYEYLMVYNESEFKIVIFKESQALKDDNFMVFYDYYIALYIGQKLSEIATSFAYFVPCVYKTGYFAFEFTITDMEKLSDTLYCILQGYDPDSDEESFLKFQDEAAAFMESAEYDQVTACQGLLAICEKYLD